jgi:hypothetical protein
LTRNWISLCYGTSIGSSRAGTVARRTGVLGLGQLHQGVDATALLDRGYGRPAQSLDLHLSADAITKTDAELVTLEQRMIAAAPIVLQATADVSDDAGELADGGTDAGQDGDGGADDEAFIGGRPLSFDRATAVL